MVYSRHAWLLTTVSCVGLLLAACSSVPESKGLVAEAYSCGQLKIQTSSEDNSHLLSVRYLDKQLLLKPKKSASGALYVGPGDDNTRFWSKGERATLTIHGQTYPECLQPGALEMPFRAQGSEPFWQIVTDGTQLVLTRPYEEDDEIRLPLKTMITNRHGSKVLAEGENLQVTLTVANQLCEDTMSGAQFPSQARLSVNGNVYNGCGGAPERLFRGAEWVVEDLAGGGIIDMSRITVNFLEDGRIGGRASCNQYSGSYQLTGEGGITFDHLAVTRMACAPALMNQEDRFLDILNRVSGIRIGRNGELLLLTPDSDTLKAFVSDHES
jgi:heat shock protein HslJ/membrane-bound inhibitor of C-type lysozyme